MRKSTIIGAMLAGSLALAGCTPSEEPSNMPPAPGTPPPETAHQQGAHGQADGAQHTSTDQEFAQRMLSHNQHVQTLTGLANQNSQNPRTKDLAARIQQAQQSYVTQIQAWLGTTAGRQSGSAPEDASPVEQESEGVPSPETLQQLRQARGPEFDRLWSQAMVALHEAAMETARDEIEEGSAQEMRDLADKLVDARQAEIGELETLK